MSEQQLSTRQDDYRLGLGFSDDRSEIGLREEDHGDEELAHAKVRAVVASYSGLTEAQRGAWLVALSAIECGSDIKTFCVERGISYENVKKRYQDARKKLPESTLADLLEAW